MPYLSQLGFDVVGFGCTTCIGNSGPLAPEIEGAIAEGSLVAAAVLSGNRNFEGRIHARVQANYLASPPLVVAYALAGDVNIDLCTEALGKGRDGRNVHLADLWPTSAEIDAVIAGSVASELFTKNYADVYGGGAEWRAIRVPGGDTYAWDDDSTYVRRPPYFDGMPRTPAEVSDIRTARVLAAFGDSITTDHISPAGAIAQDSPAGRYLVEHGVAPRDFNSYGSRRGNHEVMMRGTFANIRIKNRLVPGVEGGVTVHHPSGEQLPIYDAAMRYVEAGIPTVILAGKEYGTGSSRDWAAKGPSLQGVRAVIAESFERIHRSNLVGMGVLPLEFPKGKSMESLGLDGRETIDIQGLATRFAAGTPTGGEVRVRAIKEDGAVIEFQARVRIDTPEEANYYEHGGILHYVLRRLAN
jgi:aconitate hydratase